MPLQVRLAQLQLATMLLTRLPAGHLRDPAPTIGQSAWAFPVLGVVVGGLSAAVLLILLWLQVPALMASGLALATGILVTGGLHEDGLADVADGFGGGHDRARKLEIMRDSRIGSYGTLALIVSLGLRWQGLGAVAQQGPVLAAIALVALAISSRAGLPTALVFMPVARPDGLGKLASGATARSAMFSACIGLLALLALGPWTGLGVFVAQCAVQSLFAGLALRQIGGQTGDVLGAMQQLAELTGWIVLTAACSVTLPG